MPGWYLQAYIAGLNRSRRPRHEGLNQQPTLCDQALKSDPCFSSMPLARVVEMTWIHGLPKVVGKSFNRNQLTAHVAELEG